MLKSRIQVLLSLRFSAEQCLKGMVGMLMIGLPFIWWWQPFVFREMVVVFVTTGIVLLLLICKPSRGNVLLGRESLLLLLLFLYLLIHSLFVPSVDRGGLLLNLSVAGVFYGVVRLFRFSVRWVCSVLSGAGILQLVVVVLQSSELFRMAGPLQSVSGSFPNRALAAAVIAVGGVASLYFLFSGRGRWGWRIVLLFQLVILIILGSRAAWLAWLGGCLWVLYFRYRTVVRGFVKGKRCLSGVALLLIMCALLSGLYRVRSDSVDGRLLIWRVTLQLIAGAPLSGHGMGSFERLYMPAQADFLSQREHEPVAQLADNNCYVFSEPLRLWCEWGVIGLLGVAAVFISFLTLNLHGNRLYLSAIGVSIGIFGLFSYPFSHPFFLFVAVLLLGAGGTTSFRISVPGIYGRKILLVAGLACLAWGGCRLRTTQRAWRWLEIQRQALTAETEESVPEFPSVFRGNTDFIYHYAGLLVDYGRFEAAIPVLRQAYELRPHTEIMLDLGRCYRQSGNYADAESCFLRALRLLPCRLKPLYYLLLLYEENGEYPKGVEVARRIRGTSPKIVNTSSIRIKQAAKEFLKQYDSACSDQS